MNQNMMDRYLAQNPKARASFEELERASKARMAEIERQQEAERRDAEAKLDEVRAVGRKLYDDRIAAEREAAAAAKAAAEQKHRDEIEAAVKRSFLMAGGLPEEWEAEKAEVLREHRRRAALEAQESDRLFWRRHFASSATMPNDGR